MSAFGTTGKATGIAVILTAAVKLLHAVDAGNQAFENAMPPSRDKNLPALVAEFVHCTNAHGTGIDARQCQDIAARNNFRMETAAHKASGKAFVKDLLDWPIG